MKGFSIMKNASEKGSQTQKSASVQKGGSSTTPAREGRKQLAGQYKPVRPQKTDKK